MDSNKKKQQTEKYWEGLSSLEEEKLLQKDYRSDEGETAAYFQQLEAFSKLTLPEEKKQQLLHQLEEKTTAKKRFLKPFFMLKMAAVIACCLGASIWLFQLDNKVIEPVHTATISKAEQEKAFEITKQALMLVSAKLNKASKVTVALDKFEAAQAKIEGE